MPYAERGLSLFDGPGGAIGIDFFFGRWDLFFARQRDFFWGVFFWGCFFGDFCCFWGVFLCFFGVFFCFSRAARNFLLAFFFRGDFFFSRGREQNVKFPLWPYVL